LKEDVGIVSASNAREDGRAMLDAARRVKSAFTLVGVAVVLAAVPLFASCEAVKHPIATQRAGAVPDYFDTSELDLTKLLPPAPANDSATTRADLEEMLKVQQTRSATQSERARADVPATIYRLADALGNPAAFNAKSLPLTDAMFRKVLASELAVVGAAKSRFSRPRPFLLEPKLEPLIDKPSDGSYPSGHSSWARAVALVLADMVPERRAQILARADEYAYNRVVVGVHYPSDVAAGKLAGTAIAAALWVSPNFRADLAAATTELRRALNLPASPSDRSSLSDSANPNDRSIPSDRLSPSGSASPIDRASAVPASPSGATAGAPAAARPTTRAVLPAKAVQLASVAPVLSARAGSARAASANPIASLARAAGRVGAASPAQTASLAIVRAPAGAVPVRAVPTAAVTR